MQLEWEMSGERKEKRDSSWIIQGSVDRYDVKVEPYLGVDYSRVAFLFCGQGGMRPGLISSDLLKKTSFGARMAETDKFLSGKGLRPLSAYLTDPNFSSDEAERNLFASLGQFFLQVSMFETLISKGHRPSLLSAHSFGEFAQICVSGALSYSKMLVLLFEREMSLREVKGHFVMFAVNHSSRISNWPVRVEPANINSDFQTVYVCRDEDYPQVKSFLKTERVAHVKIGLSYPFHTSWMEPARESLRTKLDSMALDLVAPKIPFVSSVTRGVFSKETFQTSTLRGILLDQLVTPVQFVDQMDVLTKLGFASFIELSPVDVLEGLIHSYSEARELRFRTSSFRKAVKTDREVRKSYERFKASKFLGKLDSALQALTGYSIQQIRLDDRIREDLGIDSIKKAEIVFEIIDSMSREGAVTPANLSDLTTFGDILEYFETSRLAAASLKDSAETSTRQNFEFRTLEWEKCALNDFQSYSLPIRRLNGPDILEGRQLFKIESSELLVIDLNSDNEIEQEKTFHHQLLKWVLFFREKRLQCNGLVLVHPGTLLGHCLEGLLRSLSLEQGFYFKSIEAVNTEVSDATIVMERADFAVNRVRYEHGVRKVRAYKPVAQAISRSPSSVLAFGGLGGIGLHLLRSLADGTLKKLVIVGRRELDEDSDLILRELRKSVAVVEFVRADLSIFGAADEVLQMILKEHGQFDLVLHSVGYEVSEPLSQTSEGQLERILDAKMYLAFALYRHALLDSETKIIFNSSLVSEFGSAGQAMYGVANSILNGLSASSQSIVSLLWPGWASVGVAGQELNARTLKLQGAELLTSDRGQVLFAQALAKKSGCLVALPGEEGSGLLRMSNCRPQFEWLLRPASRDGSLYTVPGITQKALPYLTDHLIKRACIFPASGSISLMLFRLYIERGSLPNVHNFMAHNFYVVREDTSNILLEKNLSENGRVKLIVKSHQVMATAEFAFEESFDHLAIKNFDATSIGVSDYDQNVAVYAGPKFQLTLEAFVEEPAGRVLMVLNLDTAPRFFPIAILDKIHRMIELAFNTAHAKVIYDTDKFTVPKSAERIEFCVDRFTGRKFFAVVDRVQLVEDTVYLCDVAMRNERGEMVMFVKGLRSILVGFGKSTKTREFKMTKIQRRFFSSDL